MFNESGFFILPGGELNLLLAGSRRSMEHRLPAGSIYNGVFKVFFSLLLHRNPSFRLELPRYRSAIESGTSNVAFDYKPKPGKLNSRNEIHILIIKML